MLVSKVIKGKLRRHAELRIENLCHNALQELNIFPNTLIARRPGLHKWWLEQQTCMKLSHITNLRWVKCCTAMSSALKNLHMST